MNFSNPSPLVFSSWMCYNDAMKSKKYLQFQLESQRDHADYFHAEKYLSDGYYAHFHRNAELYCVYEGAVTVTIGKNEYALRAGEGVFIDSLQVHSYLCDEKAEIGFVLFGETFMQPFHKTYPNMAPPVLLNDREANKPLLDHLSSIGDRKFHFDTLEAYAHTSMLLHYIVSAYGIVPAQEDRKSSDFIIANIIQYIYDHADEDITLTSLAEQFGYNRMSVSHLLSKYVHIDLRNFVNDIRVQKVIALQTLPENKNVSTLELASRCGFKSVSSFYRAYKRSLENR